MDAVQVADQYLLNKAIHGDLPDVQTSSAKTIVAIPDNNQGSYSGIINFDASSQLTGSTKFCSLEDSYVVIPYSATMKVGGTLRATPQAFNRFSLCPKFNNAMIVDSLQVELNNKTILTEQSFKSYWNNVRAWTETTQDEVVKYGTERNLFLDDWKSINHSAADNSYSGDGYSNNQANRTVSIAASPSADVDMTESNSQEPHSFNDGYFKRLLNHAPVVIDATENTGSFSWPTFGKTATKQIVNQLGKNCFKEFAAPKAPVGGLLDPTDPNKGYVGSYFWNHKIKLTDLHPIFKALPLTANCQLKLKLRINQGEFTITGTSFGYTLTNSIMTSGSTCPLMVSSSFDSNPLKDRLASGGTLTVGYGAISNSLSNPSIEGSGYFPFNQARLYCPLYEIANPSGLISSPTKTVRYLDCYAQLWQKQAGLGVKADGTQHNAPFNLQASGNFKNIKYVALLPFAETSSGNYNSAHDTPTYQSPLDSCPATLQPGSAIRNFQVEIGGDSVFNNKKEYDFSSFRDEISKLHAINGGLGDFHCGLLSENQWSLANRMLVADTSRLTQRDVPASVVVSGVNGSAQSSDLLLLIVMEKEIELDVLTGEIYRFDS